MVFAKVAIKHDITPLLCSGEALIFYLIFFRARQKQFQIEYGNSEYSGISSIFESWIIYMCICIYIITSHDTGDEHSNPIFEQDVNIVF